MVVDLLRNRTPFCMAKRLQINEHFPSSVLTRFPVHLFVLRALGFLRTHFGQKPSFLRCEQHFPAKVQRNFVQQKNKSCRNKHCIYKIFKQTYMLQYLVYTLLNAAALFGGIYAIYESYNRRRKTS